MPATSVIAVAPLPLLTMFNPSDPFKDEFVNEPVVAVTVYEAPLPEIPVIDDPAKFDAASWKFAAATFLTGSEKITVHDTDAAFVGEPDASTGADTVGAVVSTVQV